MNKFTYKSKYNSYQDCHFIVGRYPNGNLAVEIISDTEGPITKVTVNPNVKLEDDYIAIKDYSENEGMVEFLVSMGIIVENPVMTIPSGFVFIPVHRLTNAGKISFSIN